jgi:hypothetical protein
MATKLLVCPECASEVAPGRFACTSCGALLASVASAPRSLGWMEAMTPPAVTSQPAVNSQRPADLEHVVDAVEPAASESNTIGPAWAHGPLERAPGETDGDLAGDESTPRVDTLGAHSVGAADGAQPGPDAQPVAQVAAADVEPGPNGQFDGDAEVARDDAPLAIATASPVAAEEHASSVEPPAVSVEPPAVAAIAGDVAGRSLAATASEPSWPETRGWPPPGAGQPAPEPPQRPRAGAYLPPSAVLTTVGEASEAARAQSSAGPAAVAAASAAQVAVPAPAATAPRSRRWPEIDPAFPPQAVLVGAALAALGFLLPWAPIVIGSTHTGGYLDQWGLAGPGHAALLLVVVALGAAASQVDRLPGWARPGLPAVILSGVLIGLVWPYLFVVGFQPSAGVYLTLIAAIVLVAGGLLDLWVTRHAGGARPV